MTSEPTRKRLSLILAPLAMGVLSACGGGGGGGVDIAEGGIRGTGSSVGPISGFGSVFVNGVRFETDGNVVSNDGIGFEAQLDKGMILRIDGEWRTDGQGTASAVEYDDTFRGVISSVSSLEQARDGSIRRGAITMFGQSISFDRRTVFSVPGGFVDESSLKDRLVRISAWRTSEGYRASYVGVIDVLPNQTLELEGLAGSHDEAEGSFRIGTQRVIYLSDEVFRDGLTADDLNNASRSVEVEGLLYGDTITAETIRPADSRRFLGTEDEDIELTGPVEGYTPSETEFLLNGVTIVITDDTEFDDISRNRLQDGLLVKVEGEFRGGVVIAEEIELFEGDSEVQARVLGEGLRPNSWNIGGVTVVLTNSTLIEYDDGLSAISTGVYAEVEGIERRTDSDVYLEALNIEVEASGDSDFEMTGRFSPAQLQGSILEVLGVSMTLAPDAIEDDLSECDFVEVEYRQGNSGFIVSQVECEDD